MVVLVVGGFRSTFADWNDVPSGSMKPTILEGDRIVVNKLAYDLKVPFTRWRLARWSSPQRVDIAVLFSPADGKRLVKRVVGLPGDTLAMVDDRVAQRPRRDWSPRPAIRDAVRDRRRALVARVDEIDKLVSAWTATHTTEAAVSAFHAAGVPVGQVRRIPDLLADRGAPAEPNCAIDGFLKFQGAEATTANGALHSAAISPPPDDALPLTGLRVLEIGPYTAGPLAGRYLADLGAEVIKIEPAGGEVSRRWDPKGGQWSVFFVNANAGKKFLSAGSSRLCWAAAAELGIVVKT